jgi:hypothetical protein
MSSIDCRFVGSSLFVVDCQLLIVSVGCRSVFSLSVPTSAYTLQGSRNRAKTNEPEFVNF